MKVCVSCFALFLALSFMGAAGQTSTGSINGSVFDASGAVVPKASVSIRNRATDLLRTGVTSGDGSYDFAAVPAGAYTIHVAASGFAPADRLAEVTVAGALRVDVTISTGPVAESTTVVGEGGISIITETPELSSVVTSRQLLQLPTINRDPYAFVALAPGAGRSDPDTRGVGYSVNGQRTSSGNFILDGGDNNDSFAAGPAQQIPLDSVEEYRLQTNNYSAEYGRGAGFIANVITKSGTNRVHGSLYDYNRNSAFAANTYDNKANSLARPHFNRNQPGVSLGGPLLRDKLFLFGNYEGIRIRSTAPVKFYVPTPQLLAISSPGTQAIFQRYPVPSSISTTDTRTRTVCPYALTCALSSQQVTLPAFAAVFRNGPYDAGAGAPQNTSLLVTRLDYNPSPSNQLSFNYDYQQADQFATVQQAYSPTLDQPVAIRNQHSGIGFVHTYTPRLVSESRLVYSRVVNNYPLTPSQPFPIFSIDSEGGANLPGGLSIFSAHENQYQVLHSVSWAKGNHNFKFGGAIEYNQQNLTQGSFQDPVARFADLQGFIAGTIHNYLIALNPQGQVPPGVVNPPFGPPSYSRPFRSKEPSLYAQDSWRITPRLTLSAGLRYEYFGIVHSAGNAARLDSNYSYGPGNNIYQKIANGKYVAVNNLTGDLKGRLYRPEYLDFSPRVGFSYDLTGKGNAVFRAGAGRFYDRNFGNVIFGVAQNPPAYATTLLTDIPVNQALLANVYSAFPSTPTSLLTTDGQFLDPNLRNAYTLTWNAGMQMTFHDRFIAGLTYVGSSASHLYVENQINRVGSGIFLGRPDERLNNQAASIRLRGSLAHASYNALQATLNSTVLPKLGLQFGISYTWSHSMDNASNVFGEDNNAPIQDGGFVDPFNPSLDRGNSTFDITNLASGNYVWEFPWFLHSSHSLARYTLGGWGSSGLITLQSGMPFTLADTGAPNFTEESTRPTWNGTHVSSVRVSDASAPNVFLILPVNNVHDPAANCQPQPFGCAPSVDGPFNNILPRDTFRRPGTIVNNIAFFKNLSGPRERFTLQLRGEFYNLFNHPNLYFSPSSLDVNTSQFNTSTGSTPGVVASFRDSRQVVLALRASF